MKFGGSHRCPCVSPSSGLIRGCSGAALGLETEKNKTFLRIYGIEGDCGGRGAARRGSANQNVAGKWRNGRNGYVTVALSQGSGGAPRRVLIVNC